MTQLQIKHFDHVRHSIFYHGHLVESQLDSLFKSYAIIKFTIFIIVHASIIDNKKMHTVYN